LSAEVVGQNRFGDLFRDADVEAIAAAAGREIDLPEHASLRVEPGHALLDARREEGLDEADGFEGLERARMHDRRTVPVQRGAMGIGETAADPAAVQLGGEEEPRGTCAHHEDGDTRSHVDRLTLAVKRAGARAHTLAWRDSGDPATVSTSTRSPAR